MKNFLSITTTIVSLSAVAGISNLPSTLPATAQSQAEETLFYTYSNKRISLTKQENTIGVAFKTSTQLGESKLPHLQLQQDLQLSTRLRRQNIQVYPLGLRYALVRVNPGTRNNTKALQEKIQQQNYVDSTLPVVSRQGHEEEILVSNEIIVSFDENIPDNQKREIIEQQNLEIIRPIAFSNTTYLVKTKSKSSVSVLKIANQLNQAKVVKSATPNFIVVQ